MTDSDHAIIADRLTKRYGSDVVAVARVAIVTVAVATVLAYLFAVRRVDSYTLD